MLQDQTISRDQSSAPETPGLYGAELVVRPATPHDLPPSCVWIKAKNNEDAARQIQKKVVEDKNVSAIWVPPETRSDKITRSFFKASVGEISHFRWQFKARSETPEHMLEKLRVDATQWKDIDYTNTFGALSHYKQSRHYTARKELLERATTFGRVLKAYAIDCTTALSTTYAAHALAFDIHADISRPDHARMRILIPWYGASSFLYDTQELSLDEDKTKKVGFPTFNPRGGKVTAWAPPDNALIVLMPAQWNPPMMSAHSAKGSAYAGTASGRALTKLDIYLP